MIQINGFKVLGLICMLVLAALGLIPFSSKDILTLISYALLAVIIIFAGWFLICLGVSGKRKKLAADAADYGTGMLCQSDFKMEFIYPVFCCGNDLRLHRRFGYTHKKRRQPSGSGI